MQPSGCTKHHPARSVSGWRGPLYSHCDTLLFLLGLAPGGVVGDVLREMYE